MAETMVVGTDGSATATRAVAEAVRLATALGAELHIVSAYESGHEAPDAVLDQAAAGARDARLAVSTHAVPGDPVEVLISVASDVRADVIVVGNQGMHGVRRVLGSVPNAISHKAACSVLIVSTDEP